MLKNFPSMLASCFMLSSPYYAENYASIIDTCTGLIRMSQLIGLVYTIIASNHDVTIHCKRYTEQHTTLMIHYMAV